MFIQALNEYNEVVKIEFCDSSEVRLTIPMNDAFHFWGAVLTRTKGGAVTAFRNLLAGRVPGASELEAFYLDLSLTCGIRQVSTFSQPQALRTTGQRVVRPVCRVVVTKGQLILSWPVTPQQGQVR
jgi:hypothetical protein